MKILYGVQCTGNGHISRSREIVRALKVLGHHVEVLFSGRRGETPPETDDFGPYAVYHGLTFATAGGKVLAGRTALQSHPLRLYRDIAGFTDSGYDLVITDFEPLSSRIARRLRLPCMGIGHHYAFVHDIPRVSGHWPSRQIMRRFAPVDIPVGLHWSSFGHPILPPIVPRDLRPKTPSSRILVYLPVEDPAEVRTVLRQIPERQFVLATSGASDSDDGNLLTRSHDRRGFLAELCACDGVICNAGFELPSEALQLGKRLLVTPLSGQFEQGSNALALSQLGLGTAVKRLDPAAIRSWLEGEPAPPRAYPDVATEIATWVDTGDYTDPGALAQRLWRGVAH